MARSLLLDIFHSYHYYSDCLLSHYYRRAGRVDALDPSTVKGPDVVTVPDADKGSSNELFNSLLINCQLIR